MYVDLTLAKQHLNIDATYSGDDTYITYLIGVAEATVAQHIHCNLDDVADGEQLPAPLCHAILLYTADLYDSREGNAYGVNVSQIPFSYDYLCSLYMNYGDTTSDNFVASVLSAVAQSARIDSDGNLAVDSVEISTNSLAEKAKARIANNVEIDADGRLKANTR